MRDHDQTFSKIAHGRIFSAMGIRNGHMTDEAESVLFACTRFYYVLNAVTEIAAVPSSKFVRMWSLRRLG